MITTADLTELKNQLIEGMKKNFKTDAGLSPVVIIINPDGQMTQMITPYTNQLEKTLMMNAVRGMCKEADAIALFIINEACRYANL